ncbi:hypothetical protein L7F22_026583 [Adiantum nelumboides]|nr:hypothetical protein [Adiantum nelumboides]
MVSSPMSVERDELRRIGAKKLSESGLTTPERPLVNKQLDIVHTMSNASSPGQHEELNMRGGAKKHNKLMGAFKSFCHILPLPNMSCKWLALPSGPSDHPSLGSRVTGTLFGYRKGHVHFAVQEDPKSQPVLLLELATPTSTLVKEMASGLVRIALECEKTSSRGKLFHEPVWTMYCNGRKTGYALRRVCSEADVQLLSLVQAVSMGAGVLPVNEEAPEGELMYMRAKFERVVGSRDSEAFYMMNPDGTGGPELSIFLLRI